MNPLAGLTYQAIGERVIVRRHPASSRSPGGIIIPDNAQESSSFGDVLSVGPKVEDVRVLDVVAFSKYAGVVTRLGDEDLVVLHISDVLCVCRNS